MRENIYPQEFILSGLSIGRNHESANNIFKNTHSELSRIHSSGGASSEADYRALSMKDTKSVTDISKDELEYEITDLMADQDSEWEKDEIARTFGIFRD